MNIEQYMHDVGQRARKAASHIARADTADKNNALQAIAANLLGSRDKLFEANAKDVKAAQENKLDAALLDRLVLNDNRLDAMAEGLQQIATLPDPIGTIV